MGIFLRWLGAFLLLALIYNPTPWNFIVWAQANFFSNMALTLFFGFFLATSAFLYLMATERSIGYKGIALIAVFFGLVLWLLVDWGLLGLGNSALNTWLGILVLSVILGVGLSWSIIWHRLTGQASVDVVDSDTNT